MASFAPRDDHHPGRETNRRQCDLGPVARFDRHARTLSTSTERKRAETSKLLLDRCGELITPTNPRAGLRQLQRIDSAFVVISNARGRRWLVFAGSSTNLAAAVMRDGRPTEKSSSTSRRIAG